MAYQNNFNNFKSQFVSDTGLQIEGQKTVQVYIEYVKARLMDQQVQLLEDQNDLLTNQNTYLSDIRNRLNSGINTF